MLVIQIIYLSKSWQIYFYRQKNMSEKVTHFKNILIPHIHHPHTFQRMIKEEDIKTSFDHKFYIAPNRESRPLGLAPKTLLDQSYDKRFQPSFDHFNLSSMFSNKPLTELELNQFKRDKQGPMEILQTPTRKKIQNNALRQTQQTKHGHSQAKKSRPKEKGLRQLSQRAYQIVLNLRSASYKQVANKLVDELNSQKQSEHHQILHSRIQEKDQQNIKRRVYDALNVLIALGVLRKDGRKIAGDRSIKYKSEEDHKNIIDAQIQARQQTIRNKKQELRKQQAKLKLLPLLIQSNEKRKNECDKIEMPFMILDVDPNLIQGYGGMEICSKIEIKKQKQNVMKMDLDCYTQYKIANFNNT